MIWSSPASGQNPSRRFHSGKQFLLVLPDHTWSKKELEGHLGRSGITASGRAEMLPSSHYRALNGIGRMASALSQAQATDRVSVRT